MITTIKANDKVFEISLEGQALRANAKQGSTSLLCDVQLIEDNKVLIRGYKTALRVRLSAEKYSLLLNALRAVRPKTAHVAIEFVCQHDLETGMTWYTLRNRISHASWLQVAHLFESDVEIDCPHSQAWNDSVTLRWATRSPDAVRALLS